MGNCELIKLAFDSIDPTCFKRPMGNKLFHYFVLQKDFDSARVLIENGVSTNCIVNYETALTMSVGTGNIEAVSFLLNIGVNVNQVVISFHTDAALGRAAFRNKPAIAALLLEHDANTTCQVKKKYILSWSFVNCRSIYNLIKDKIGPDALEIIAGNAME
jgi:ankyrin repeat protein